METITAWLSRLYWAIRRFLGDGEYRMIVHDLNGRLRVIRTSNGLKAYEAFDRITGKPLPATSYTFNHPEVAVVVLGADPSLPEGWEKELVMSFDQWRKGQICSPAQLRMA